MPVRKFLQPLIVPVGFIVKYGFTYLVRIQTQLTVQTVSRFLDYFAMACRLTQGLIQTLGSMVIFDENQAVFESNKYEFLNTIYVKTVNFLVI